MDPGGYGFFAGHILAVCQRKLGRTILSEIVRPFIFWLVLFGSARAPAQAGSDGRALGRRRRKTERGIF
jgi:hypothetical protein